MKEELISFKTAKLAKEKGVEVDVGVTKNWYTKTGNFNSYSPKPVYWVITQALLQKWLREVHNLYVDISSVGYCKDDKHTSFRCIVVNITEKVYKHNNGCLSDIDGDWYIFRSYEKALEKGLQEALKLIVI